MDNITPITSNTPAAEKSPALLTGGALGIISFGFALITPFLFYGSSVLLFFLYTWPFFLALVPISVVIGMAFSVWLPRSLSGMVFFTLLIVTCSFWLVFAMLTSW